MGYIFNAGDEGSYADGAFGRAYVRDRLAAQVEHVANSIRGEDVSRALVYLDLVKALAAPPSDAASEEDDALAVLEEHTAPGLVWGLSGGDLVLLPDDEIW